MKDLVKNSFLSALGVGVYVVLVVTVMNTLIGMTGEGSDDENILIPITMLMLLVLSVAVVGSLIFAKPVMNYINGQKSEAVKLLMFTLGWLVALTVVAIIVLVSSI